MTREQLDQANTQVLTRHLRGMLDDFRAELPKVLGDLAAVSEQHAADAVDLAGSAKAGDGYRPEHAAHGPHSDDSSRTRPATNETTPAAPKAAESLSAPRRRTARKTTRGT